MFDRLKTLLVGARFVDVVQPRGERRCSLVFQAEDRTRVTIECELFGNRGLWVVLDRGGRIAHLSRLPDVKDRTLTPGAVYSPPAAAARATQEPADDGRFTTLTGPELLAAVDATFTAFDESAAANAARTALQHWLDRQLRATAARIEGLQRQAESATQAPALRAEADLLLAYAHLWRKGATTLTVDDPTTGAPRVLDVDPQLPPPVQARAKYDRARRLEDAVAVHAARTAEAMARHAELEALREGLAVADDTMLDGIAAKATPLGFRPTDAPATPHAPRPRTRTEARAEPRTPGGARAPDESFRRFTSIEGFVILAGKSNTQNDRLSLRVAHGNDLWFHIGRGHAGSHVVVRLPKGKTASLETMLDAATIAVHFSKARGEPLAEVVYTHGKHVRKPKGAAPGSVTITQEKTLRVRHDAERLKRLLDSASDVDAG